MDYKKKYEDALKIAKDILDNRCIKGTNNAFYRADLEVIFPELAESDDERIRKYIIKVVHEWWVRCNDPAPDFPNEEQMLAWLEKQGKQKFWSEKDETNLRQTEYAVMKFFGGDCLLVGWLRKSLKEKYSWKPSEEQINAFEQVYDWYNNNFAASETLTSLYQDLKKLKGE